MSKNAKTVAVVPLPQIKIIEIADPATELHVEPLNARFTLELIDLSAEIDGKKVPHYWREAVKDSDLIHVHQMDGQYYATDGNRRVATLKQLAETDPAAYRAMLAEYSARTGHGFQVACYKGDLSPTQRLWALRDVDAAQKPWTDAEKLAQFRRLIETGATVVTAAAFFGQSRMPDFERIIKMPTEVADLWIETRRDEQLSKADPKGYTRKYSSKLTGPQVQELSKKISAFQKDNPGATATGPEYQALFAETIAKLETPKEEAANQYSPPKIPDAHKTSLSPVIGQIVTAAKARNDATLLLAAQALAIGIGLALDEEKPENITRIMRADDIANFKAIVSTMTA